MERRSSRHFWSVLGLATLVLAGSAQAADKPAPSALQQAQARGMIRCGANAIVGYAMPDPSGQWSGFMVDLCRAVAAAALGSAEKFEILPVESKTRFPALRERRVDMLVDGATWTLDRDSSSGLSFPAVWLYDGQAFLAHRSAGLKSIKDLKPEHNVCVADGTTTRRNLEDFLAVHKLGAQMVVNQSDEGSWSSFLKGRCHVVTNDRFGLVLRAALHSAGMQDYVMLPETISKEPLGPVVLQGDEQFFKLVRWVVLAMVAAEERGVSSLNVTSLKVNGDAELAVLTGTGPDHAASLGVPPGWARRVIEQVGNYGEVFERHFGPTSPVKADRALNALWTKGGLMYAPPLR